MTIKKTVVIEKKHEQVTPLSIKSIDIKSIDIKPIDIKPICLKVSLNERKMVTDKLVKILGNHIPDNLIKELENEVHNNIVSWAYETGISDSYDTRLLNTYKYRLNLILQHLHPDTQVKNTYLHPKLLSGELTPKNIAEMQNESDMNPLHWRCTRQKTIEAKQISHGEQRSLCDLIKCGKCGGNTEFTEKQASSGDEPMTVRVNCPRCNKTFIA